MFIMTLFIISALLLIDENQKQLNIQKQMGGGGHMYTCGWFMLMYGKKTSQYCKVIILQLKYIN